MRRITIGGVSITTAATHVCVLCMRYCNGLIAYILLHYLMKFHLEITKDKEMTTFLYVLSDHPTYVLFDGNKEKIFDIFVCSLKTLPVGTR